MNMSDVGSEHPNSSHKDQMLKRMMENLPLHDPWIGALNIRECIFDGEHMRVRYGKDDAEEWLDCIPSPTGITLKRSFKNTQAIIFESHEFSDITKLKECHIDISDHAAAEFFWGRFVFSHNNSAPSWYNNMGQAISDYFTGASDSAKPAAETHPEPPEPHYYEEPEPEPVKEHELKDHQKSKDHHDKNGHKADHTAPEKTPRKCTHIKRIWKDAAQKMEKHLPHVRALKRPGHD